MSFGDGKFRFFCHCYLWLHSVLQMILVCERSCHAPVLSLSPLAVMKFKPVLFKWKFQDTQWMFKYWPNHVVLLFIQSLLHQRNLPPFILHTSSSYALPPLCNWKLSNNSMTVLNCKLSPTLFCAFVRVNTSLKIQQLLPAKSCRSVVLVEPPPPKKPPTIDPSRLSELRAATTLQLKVALSLLKILLDDEIRFPDSTPLRKFSVAPEPAVCVWILFEYVHV